MQVVSYGAGTNSTAMLVGLYERGERPDIILFADTGGERPETYRHLKTVSGWCASVGFPEIDVCAEKVSLEDDCLNRGALPGIAYGFKSCSEHYKTRPQKRWLKEHGHSDVKYLVGIDAGEIHRKRYDDVRYPLIEWDWGRHDCVQAIARAGLPQPGKSACFFCPSSKQHEVRLLFKENRDLFDRALAIEDGAKDKTTSVKGLGRGWSWRELIYGDPRQMSFDADWLKFCEVETPCGCYDG